MYQKAATGSGQDQLLLKVGNARPSQWSHDGRYIVYRVSDQKNKSDIWVLPVGEGASVGAAVQKPIPFLQTEFEELYGQLSPDSHWMAYASDKTGRREVYVRPFPPAEGEWQISISGGGAPRWRGDGRELFFEAGDGKMMAVPIKTTAGANPSFAPGTPAALFDAHITHNPGGGDLAFQYDVTADGKRFLINTPISAANALPLTVVVNWDAELKK